MYRKCIKRLLDILISGIALIILLPVYAVVALLVRIKLGSPVIFSQQRPGRDGKIFRLYKFRTMTDARDADGALLPDAERMTKFGNLLRSTSIDELPELWNIFIGQMSLVGPRPLLVSYLPLYNEHQRKRHNVRPGLTGLAQVNGRNAISWEARFDLDVEYAAHVTFLNDVKILIKTVTTVFYREGIHSENNVTMEPFQGTK